MIAVQKENLALQKEQDAHQRQLLQEIFDE